MKSISRAFVLSLAAFVSISNVTSASGVSLTCKLMNEVKTIKGKDNLCTKVGGKLVWKISKTEVPDFSLSEPISIPDGFTTDIADFDSSLNWKVSTTSGKATLDELGIITVDGYLIAPGSLDVRLYKGKYFRLHSYAGTAYDLKTIESATFASSMTLTSDGFKVAILNFDSSKYWDVTTSMGSSYVDDSGYLIVSDIDKAGTVVINLKISADGFRSLAKTYTYDLPESTVVPQLATPSNITNNSFDVRISNYDPNIKWTAKTSAGLASLSSSGVVTISGLLPNQTASVTVAASAEGKRISTATVSGSAGAVFSSISEREWALIAKDPQGNIGKAIIIFGYITQFDAATGLNQFRADVNGINSRTTYGFTGDNTFLTGDVQLLKNFVAKDYFTAKVIVKGSRTYTTTLNGSLTVPSLEVVEISRS